MFLSSNIRHLRKSNEWSQDYLADKLGYKSYTTIQKWEMGISEPPFRKLAELADLFRISVNDLANKDLENPNSVPTSLEKAIGKIRLYNISVSAGAGEWLSEGHEYTWVEHGSIPDDADFALKVKGDSMSPLYNDKDIVFIRQNVNVEPGQVGVFMLNNEGYLKRWLGNKLVSDNPEYEPIAIGEYDSFYIGGKVIGKL